MAGSTSRFSLVGGSVLGFLSVAGGAFGAHALRDRLPADRMAIFETGVRYAMFHALALLIVGVLALRVEDRRLGWASRAFVAGAVLFSGSLWLLVLLDQRWLGAITPLGGLSFLLGWLLLGRVAASTPATRPDSTRSGNSSG